MSGSDPPFGQRICMGPDGFGGHMVVIDIFSWSSDKSNSLVLEVIDIDTVLRWPLDKSYTLVGWSLILCCNVHVITW